MTRIAYVNGRYVDHHEASIHVEDRGYQFADGVYEVIVFYNRTLVDGDLHLARLQRSLNELDITPPMGERALSLVIAELLARNSLKHGMVYMQVTRGVARRDHAYGADTTPALVMTVAREKPVNAAEMQRGGEVIIRPDIRWQRRNIKSISLLPNALLKHEAVQLGKREAWLTDADGFITEGAVSNAYIVDANGTLITRGEEICLLSGITRHRVLALAKEAGVKVEERAFTVEEAKQAKEAFITSSTSHIVPIVKIDDATIGNGKPGVLTLDLFRRYANYIQTETGYEIWPL